MRSHRSTIAGSRLHQGASPPISTGLKRIDAFAQARREDRSTAIRQLADLALTELAKHEALQAYRQGRVTLREFARTLGVDPWAAHDLLASAGIAIGQGARAETRDALEAVLKELGQTT